jgi:hypothetical protein
MYIQINEKCVSLLAQLCKYANTPRCVQTTQRYTHCLSTTVRVQANYNESACLFTKFLRVK